MKANNTNRKESVPTNNPFAMLASAPSEKAVHHLDYTPALQNKAHERAIELCKSCTTPELQEKANRMMDTGDAADLIDLIHSVFDDETIKSDATVLDGCPDGDLAKMLESQRSNRSKSKKAGLKSKLQNTVAYISAMYAELLIRQKTGKAYAGTTAITLDIDKLKSDDDLLKRKINSLASKKSRLHKLAEYDEAAKAELNEVESQLAELRALRPNASRTAVKSVSVTELKKALKQLDKADLPEDVLALIEKLG